MFYYIVGIIILIAILMYSLIEFVHLSNKSFKKYSKILILILLIGISFISSEVFSSRDFNYSCDFFNTV